MFSGYPFLATYGYNNPLWYICILIQCYMAFFIIQKLTQVINISPVICYVTIIVGMYVVNKLLALDSHVFRGWTAFFMGAFLCWLLQDEFKGLFLKHNKVILVLCTIGVIITIVFLIITNSAQIRNVLVLGTLPCLIIICYLLQLKERPKVSSTASISFEVYVWHAMILDLLQIIFNILNIKVNHNYTIMIIITAIIGGISSLLYLYLERPLFKWINEKNLKIRFKNVF